MLLFLLYYNVFLQYILLRINVMLHNYTECMLKLKQEIVKRSKLLYDSYQIIVSDY